MRFNYLYIENYKSFQLPVKIEFPVGEDGKSIFLVGGMNGAGKTSVMEAINICLYGEKNDVIYKAINYKELKKSNANVNFELEFVDDNNDTVLIKRSWACGSSSNKPMPKDLAEKLVVVKNGKRVTITNKDMWQDYINSTIPKSITQFFFFDGEKIKEIASDDHSEVILRDSLEAALGIQYISRLNDDIIRIKQEERKTFVEVADEDIDFLEAQLRKERKALDNLNDDLEDCKAQLEEFKKQRDEANERFKSVFSAEPQSIDELKAKERRRLQLSSQLAQLDGQIHQSIERNLPWAIASPLFNQLKQQIEKEHDIHKGRIYAANAEELTFQIIQSMDNPRPVLGNPLSVSQKEELQKRLMKLFGGTAPEEEIEKILNLSDRDSGKLLAKLDEIEQSDILQLNEFIEQKSEYEAEIKVLEDSLMQRGSSQSEKDLFDELQNILESCNTQIGVFSAKKNNLLEQIKLKEALVKDLELDLNKKYDAHAKSKEQSLFINECENISNMLSEYIIKLRKNKIQLLRDKTFEMFLRLSTKAELMKSIDIDEKSYEMTIIDKNDLRIRKSGLSAGEKEVFAISLLWGLAQTSQLNLPIIIDTPLSRLDSKHRENIVNRYFPNAADQVIILSTDTEVDSNYFRNLESSLSGSGRLEFNKAQELTLFKPGYFWG